MSAVTRRHAYTQIRGHGLQSEGRPYVPGGEDQDAWVRPCFHIRACSCPGRGLCSCGATSDMLDSDAARKRWHRKHKAAAAEPIPTPEEWAAEQLENAPERSEAWARRVAIIWGLELDGPAEEKR